MTYASTVLADGPVQYYRLGESSGTVATDSSGHGYNGTYTGAFTLGRPGAISGDSNTAVALAGSGGGGGYVALSTTGDSTGAAAFTLECWVLFAVLPTDYYAAMSYGTRIANEQMNIYTSPGGALNVELYGVANVAGTPVTVNTWNHIVALYTGSSLALYINNVLLGTAGAGTAAMAFGVCFAGVFANATGGIQGGYLPGSLDEIAIYNKALTSTQVSTHYNAAFPVPTVPKSMLTNKHHFGKIV